MMKKPDAHDWYLSDSSNYEFGTEQNDTHGSGECVYLKSITGNPKEYGFISKSISATPYLEKHLKMTAWIKTALPEGAHVQLWLRVDGDWKKKKGCFDNMFERRIAETTDWAEYSVEVEVPKTSATIVFGVLLSGEGHLLLDEGVLEAASAETKR